MRARTTFETEPSPQTLSAAFGFMRRLRILAAACLELAGR